MHKPVVEWTFGWNHSQVYHSMYTKFQRMYIILYIQHIPFFFIILYTRHSHINLLKIRRIDIMWCVIWSKLWFYKRTQFFNEFKQFCKFNVHNISKNVNNFIYSTYTIFQGMYVNNYVYSTHTIFQWIYTNNTISHIPCTQIFKDNTQFFIFNIYNISKLCRFLIYTKYQVLYIQHTQFFFLMGTTYTILYIQRTQ